MANVVSCCLLTNRNDMSFYRTKNEKIYQRICIFSFAINLSQKYGKQLLDTATITGLDLLKLIPDK